MSVQYRLNRLFAADGKCCEVAMDHGVHNEPSFLPGIENLGKVVDVIADGGADAILLSMGLAPLLQSKIRPKNPALVLRADPTNFYGMPAQTEMFCNLQHLAVERALALDAVGLVVNLLWAADRPNLHRQCVNNISRLKPECDRYGMPLIVESLLMMPDPKTGGYKHDSDVARSVGLVRQAVELGADAVKTDPLDNLDGYCKVIEAAAGRPLLLRGGSRVSDTELLTRTQRLMQQGAAGVVYGRNIYQHAHPQKMLQACNAIIHEGASVEKAQAILNS